MGKRIFLCAGEISGDRHGAALVTALRELDPSLEFAGVGGTRMREAGVRLLHDSTDWGTVGFFEGVTRFPRLYPILRRLPSIMKNERTDLFIPIDFRFFNMRLCRAAKAMGLPAVYFFAPVSWYGAGGKRFKFLAETVNLSLLCLPFSLGDYELAGANFEYIGHPAVDLVNPTMTADEALVSMGLERGRITVGLMPGSRIHEIKRLMPVFRDAAAALGESIPGSQFAALSADPRLSPLIKRIVGDRPIALVERNTWDFMNACDLLIMCSGTATHEATLMEKPMVVAYRVSRLTAALVRSMMHVPFAALPNIIAGEFVVPEYIQEQCVAGEIAAGAHRLLADSEARVTMKRRLREIRMSLGSPGVLRRAAERIVDGLDGRWAPRDFTFRRTAAAAE